MSELQKKKPGIFSNLKRTFIAGVLAALPLAFTVAVVIWFAELVHKLAGPNSVLGKFLGSIGLRLVSSEILAYGVGVLLTFFLIFVLGIIVQTGARSYLDRLIENTLNQLPIVRTVYNAFKKLTVIFETKEETDLKSMSAVVCYFGGREKEGSAVLALLTSPEKIMLRGHPHYAVIIPTAPVPFGGAILYVPEEWVELAGMEFDGLLNVYMSMGATSSDFLNHLQNRTKPKRPEGLKRD
jgi:uncharacterized membrane protein